MREGFGEHSKQYLDALSKHGFKITKLNPIEGYKIFVEADDIATKLKQNNLGMERALTRLGVGLAQKGMQRLEESLKTLKEAKQIMLQLGAGAQELLPST